MNGIYAPPRENPQNYIPSNKVDFENVTEIRNVYDDCDEGGMTVLEQADAKAKMEMISIGNELIDRGLLRNE